MCDRIQKEDERNAILDLRKDGCIEINKSLEKCLNENDRDFRKCKHVVNELKICMQEKLKKQIVIENNN